MLWKVKHNLAGKEYYIWQSFEYDWSQLLNPHRYTFVLSERRKRSTGSKRHACIGSENVVTSNTYFDDVTHINGTSFSGDSGPLGLKGEGNLHTDSSRFNSVKSIVLLLLFIVNIFACGERKSYAHKLRWAAENVSFTGDGGFPGLPGKTKSVYYFYSYKMTNTLWYFSCVKVLLDRRVAQDRRDQEDQRATQVLLSWNHFYCSLIWCRKNKKGQWLTSFWAGEPGSEGPPGQRGRDGQMGTPGLPGFGHKGNKQLKQLCGGSFSF